MKLNDVAPFRHGINCMMSFRLKRLIVLIIGTIGMLALSGTLRAADFAPVTIESVVGQRVSGYIELPEIGTEDLPSLVVQLASPATYLENDVAYYSVHGDLDFQVKTVANGRIRLDLTSKNLLREPKLNVLLRLTWDQGNIVKGLALSVPFTQVALGAAKTIFTKSSDNLWQLAKRTRDGSQVSIAQQMLAIQRLNPGAFNKDNINGLKSGYLLRIPDFMDAVTVDKTSALGVVEGQHSQWQSAANDAPVEVELGADLPPRERQGEVRIFEPENFEGASLSEDLNSAEPLARVVEEFALVDEEETRVLGDSAEGRVDDRAKDSTNAAKAVDIDQSVNEQIEAMVAEEGQGSYSAQLVWLIAGGILGILIVVMLLRRQMAARKKNLEEAWSTEGESAPDDGVEAQHNYAPELEEESYQEQEGELEHELDEESEGELEEELEKEIKDQPEGEPEEEAETTLEEESMVGSEADPEEQTDEADSAVVEEDVSDELEVRDGVQNDADDASGKIEPLVSVSMQGGQDALVLPAEEEQIEPAKEETFLDVLDANEQPLGETSNTEVYTTRLKLAEAYLEMGDENGARDMLEEVVAEGDTAQKSLAQSILQRIEDGIDDSKDS